MAHTRHGDDLYPEGEDLPDVSGVSFDHEGKDGRKVGFLWGVATSSYQVEGEILSNDWSVFSRSGFVRDKVDSIAKLAKISINLEDPGKAVDHWNLKVFGDDVRRTKSLGLNAYRLSIEWSRIQPAGPSQPGSDGSGFDMDAISHYSRMLDLLDEAGLEPIVTLSHFTLPKWVLTPPTTLLDAEDADFKKSLGGWCSKSTVDAFVNYVKCISGEFKNRIKYWLTINEPMSSVAFGYLAGIWSPGFMGAEDRAKTVIFNLIDAHARAYDAIKQVAGSGSMVGMAHGMVFPKVKTENDILGVNRKATAQYDYCFNKVFLEAITDGIFNPTLMLENKDCRIVEHWKGRLDFVGLNYYRSVYIYQNELISLVVPWAGGVFDEDLGSAGARHNLLNDLGWEVYPAGLYRLLKYLDDRFGLPILITENGFAEKTDTSRGSEAPIGMRAPYVVSHACEVLHAIKDGVDVLGYLYWSIVDNWEWDYDYMPKSRFGLFNVDRESKGKGPLPRVKTLGAEALEYIARHGKIGNAAEKFGTITPSGTALLPPK